MHEPNPGSHRRECKVKEFTGKSTCELEILSTKATALEVIL